jgi:hypothetical protein
MRRIGILKNTAADEPEAQARLTAFMQGLQEVGWAVGCNLRVGIAGGPCRAISPELAGRLVPNLGSNNGLADERRCSHNNAGKKSAHARK